MEKRLLKGYILTIISAVIYGFMPLMAKSIYAEGVNALSLVFLRNALASLLSPIALLYFPMVIVPILLLGMAVLSLLLLFALYRQLQKRTPVTSV